MKSFLKQIGILLLILVVGLLCSTAIFLFLQNSVFFRSKAPRLFLPLVIISIVFIIIISYTIRHKKKYIDFKKFIVMAGVSCLASALFLSATYSFLPKNTLLMPKHILQINANNLDGVAPGAVRLYWFTANLETISFSTLQLDGQWERIADEGLVTHSTGSVTWSGITGEKATLVFIAAPDAGGVEILWDGNKQSIDFNSETRHEFSLDQKFTVPQLSYPLYWSSFFVFIAFLFLLFLLFLA